MTKDERSREKVRLFAKRYGQHAKHLLLRQTAPDADKHFGQLQPEWYPSLLQEANAQIGAKDYFRVLRKVDAIVKRLANQIPKELESAYRTRATRR